VTVTDTNKRNSAKSNPEILKMWRTRVARKLVLFVMFVE
jgi:hypothetical protein